MLKGRVRYPGTNVAAGADVFLVKAKRGTQVEKRTTDAQGYFQCSCDPDTHILVLNEEGFWYQGGAVQGSECLDVELRPSVNLRRQVLDRQGRFLPSVMVLQLVRLRIAGVEVEVRGIIGDIWQNMQVEGAHASTHLAIGLPFQESGGITDVNGVFDFEAKLIQDEKVQLEFQAPLAQPSRYRQHWSASISLRTTSLDPIVLPISIEELAIE